MNGFRNQDAHFGFPDKIVGARQTQTNRGFAWLNIVTAIEECESVTELYRLQTQKNSIVRPWRSWVSGRAQELLLPWLFNPDHGANRYQQKDQENDDGVAHPLSGRSWVGAFWRASTPCCMWSAACETLEKHGANISLACFIKSEIGRASCRERVSTVV